MTLVDDNSGGFSVTKNTTNPKECIALQLAKVTPKIDVNPRLTDRPKADQQELLLCERILEDSSSRFPTLGEVFQEIFTCDQNTKWDPSSRGVFFLNDDGQVVDRLTYKELDSCARSIAVQLLSHSSGIKSGDRVLLIYIPGLDFIKALLGCFYARVVAVPVAPHAVIGAGISLSSVTSAANGVIDRLRNAKEASNSIQQSYLSKVISDAEPKAIFCADNDKLPMGGFGVGIYAGIKMMIMGLKMANPTKSFPAVHKLDHSLSSAKANWSRFEREIPSPQSIHVDGQSEIAFLQYSSGSTGDPKAVALSHSNVLAQVRILTKAFDVKRGTSEIGLSWLPFYHDMGLIGHVLTPMFNCGSNYFLSPLSFLRDPLVWPRTISRYSAGITGGPNFAFALLTSKTTAALSSGALSKESFDLSCLRICFCGAEPLSPVVMQKFFDQYAQWNFRPECFMPCYGLAEATLGVTHQPEGVLPTVINVDRAMLETHNKIKLISPAGEKANGRSKAIVGLGRPALNTEVLIVDPDTRKPCALGAVGELWVRSPSVATFGYWRREELTQETFFATLADGPNTKTYLRTGDLGFSLEEKGDIFYASRLKDLLIVCGKKHWPQDVEDIVQDAHPSIRKGCCVAFALESSEKYSQEQLCIVTELRVQNASGKQQPNFSQEQLKEIREAIHSAIYNKLQLSLQPELLLFVKHGTVPKTTSGKIRRREAKQRFLDGGLSSQLISEANQIGAQKKTTLIEFIIKTICVAFMLPLLRMLLGIIGEDLSSIVPRPANSTTTSTATVQTISAAQKEATVEHKEDVVAAAETTPRLTSIPQGSDMDNLMAAFSEEEINDEAKVESLIVGLIAKHSLSSIGANGDGTSLDVLAPLHQLGLSSIEAMAIGTDLEKITKRKLSVTLLFEASSIADLATSVVKCARYTKEELEEMNELNKVKEEEAKQKFFVQNAKLCSDVVTTSLDNRAYIFSIATANPKFSYKQDEVFEIVAEFQIKNPIGATSPASQAETDMNEKKAQKLFQGASVGNRCFVRPIEELAALESTEDRNQVYVEEAPSLAIDAANRCISEWGGDRGSITHVLAVSCTGTIVPGLEFHLMDQLGLRRSVQRLGINFMGCFGALAALRTAQCIAQASNEHRVLVVCCELCSLHAQREEGRNRTDALVAEAIFGDGAAACIVGSAPRKGERLIYRIGNSACYGHINSMDRIKWDLSNNGWKVGLGVDITKHLVEGLPLFVTELISSMNSALAKDESHTEEEQQQRKEKLYEFARTLHWAIHPGGRAIVDAIEKCFELKGGQLSSTRDVMSTLGNMSSPTVLFVLNNLRQRRHRDAAPLSGEEQVISLAFGPGLATEGVLLSLLPNDEIQC